MNRFDSLPLFMGAALLGLAGGFACAPALAVRERLPVELRCAAATQVNIDAPSNAQVALHVVEPLGAPLSFKVAVCGGGRCAAAWPLRKDLDLTDLHGPSRITTLRFTPSPGCTTSRVTFWYEWLIVD